MKRMKTMAKAANKEKLNTCVAVPVNGKDLNFTVPPQALIDHSDSVIPGKNVYDPAFNFLTATVDDDSKAVLMELVNSPMTTLELFAEVYTQCGTDNKIGDAVKK